MKKLKFLSIVLLVVLAFTSCKKKSSNKSQATGWDYNSEENGGFEMAEAKNQATGPGLVLIEGGVFTQGRTEQDVMYDWNNFPRTETVNSFYMDETEVRNIDYREYIYWTERVFGEQYPELIIKALPDTLAWRRRLAYNEPYVEYYFRHPAYNNYPVVGVSWTQANAYCDWRTDRVNEQILVNEGFLDHNPDQKGQDNFNTDAFFAGQYESGIKKKIPTSNPNNPERNPNMADGYLLPRYQLPSEVEWEYAAIALIGNTIDERIFSRRIYPWNGHYVRNEQKDDMGSMRANFQRGRGDMMGVAGYLNDAASIPAPVDAYWPNDYGLYCMAGNVNEWTRDVYRPMTSVDAEGFMPFRGNVFKTIVRDENGHIAQKDSLGRIPYREMTEQESLGRINYTKADNINYNDGDLRSSQQTSKEGWDAEKENGGSNRMYNSEGKGAPKFDGMTSMINDKARVYKGGGWRDRAYWLSPGTRRFLDESKSSDDIGFRCSMLRVGSPTGL